MADSIEERILVDAKLGIGSASDETGQVTKTPIKDLIEADQYLAAKSAAAKNHFGLRMTKLVPPGTG